MFEIYERQTQSSILNVCETYEKLPRFISNASIIDGWNSIDCFVIGSFEWIQYSQSPSMDNLISNVNRMKFDPLW